MTVGVGFVLYLIYAELFEVGSIRLYCTGVRALTFMPFALTAAGAAIWEPPPQDSLSQ